MDDPTKGWGYDIRLVPSAWGPVYFADVKPLVPLMLLGARTDGDRGGAAMAAAIYSLIPQNMEVWFDLHSAQEVAVAEQWAFDHEVDMRQEELFSWEMPSYPDAPPFPVRWAKCEGESCLASYFNSVPLDYDTFGLLAIRLDRGDFPASAAVAEVVMAFIADNRCMLVGGVGNFTDVAQRSDRLAQVLDRYGLFLVVEEEVG